MARSHLLLACLALAAVATVQARVGSPRSLKQFASQAFCPDGCDTSAAANGCIQDATKGGLRCQKCLGDLVVNKVTGNCACPAGKYAEPAVAGVAPKCVDCPKGSWCAGSDYFLPTNELNPLTTQYPGVTAPRAQQCPVTASGNMTTIGRRATSIRSCVNLPGTSYSISADGSTIDQTTCPVNTYSPGLKKQRACVPCPTGYTTNGVTGATSPTQCVVPAGYYLKGPGQIAPCPKGEYKAGIGTNGNCTKCAFGVTTIAEASISVDNCTIVVAGYYAAAVSNGIVTSTLACPQKYYCPGGRPSRAFSASSPNPDTVCPIGTICACPQGTWTQDIAATNVEQCLTPPGHFTNATGTYLCVNGTYRADWKPPSDAVSGSCLSCGEGVKTVATDQLSEYATAGYAETKKSVTTSSDDCYIQAGQGLYYTTLTKSWRAKNCTVNAYGVSNQTFGLSPAPCRECPNNMVTSLTGTNATYSNSARYFTSLGDTMGFTDEAACVTQPGYGMSGRNAQPCDKGFWNGPNNYETCKACAYGLTTEGIAKGVAEASCGIAQGFGNVSGLFMPCPIGTYNAAAWTADRTTTCTSCGGGLTTQAEGSISADQCNMCIAGMGGDNCAQSCGGLGASATYGPIGRSTDTNPACIACTTQATGYSFDWQMGNDLYVSQPLSKVNASSSTDCVAQYSQLVDGAWFIPMPTVGSGLLEDPTRVQEVAPNVLTFAACAALCTDAKQCQFATYDYVAKTCTIRLGLPPTYVGSPLIGLKNLPSGDVGTNAWSVSKEGSGRKLSETVGAKLVSTGVYTFYRDEFGMNLGEAVPALNKGYNITQDYTPGAKLGLQECLNACDNEVQCYGIRILMNVLVEDRPTTCNLLYGNIRVGQFKRTVMRADTARMPLPSLSDY